MIKKVILSVCMCWLGLCSAQAACVLGDMFLERKLFVQAKQSYHICAMNQNDSSAQFQLGLMYRDGLYAVKRDLTQALFYLRFAAENGYAPAQTQLAKLMVSLEKMGDIGQKALATHEERVGQMKSRVASSSDSDLQTPEMTAFAWVLLAAEKPENKWFYACSSVQDPEAVKLVTQWTNQQGKGAKEQAIRLASRYKEAKIKQAAVEVYDADTYARFLKDIQSNNQRGGRDMAVMQLKQRIMDSALFSDEESK